MADPVARLLVVAVVVALLAVAPVLWRRRQHAVAAGPAVHPPVPLALLDDSPRTWVVFTTPYCASCGPATDRIRAADPSARVVTVDATVERALAGTFSVRSAPTLLLADAGGSVQTRIVGLEALDRYLLAGSRSPE